jgi:hypothetical protein
MPLACGAADYLRSVTTGCARNRLLPILMRIAADPESYGWSQQVERDETQIAEGIGPRQVGPAIRDNVDQLCPTLARQGFDE